MISMINDGLYTIDANANLFPLIAKDKPKVSSDNLTYTINLRQDVKWTDGQDLTADDVVFTYQLMYAPAYKKVNSPRRGDLEKYVDSVTAKDKYTVIFKTKSVFAPFATTHLLYAILPKHVLGSLSADEINTAPWNSAPTVTNWAFTFVKWDKGAQVTLAKNPKYYRGAPHLDGYVFKIGTVSTEVLNQMKTGEIDVGFPGIGPIDPSQYDNAKSVDNINVYSYARLSFDFFLFQLDPAKPASKFFGDKTVRQAMVYALDRKAIAHALYFDQATVANTTMPPASWAYNKDNQPVYTHDKAKAQSMLDAAGWTASGGGARHKNDDAVATLDQAQRKQLYFKMQQILADDQPAPVLVFPNGILGLNKRIQNWQYGTFIGQTGRRVFMKDVFASDGK